jgi:uncharacterized membrane protein
MIVFHWFAWFVIYSFIGWLYETALFSFRERKFINRGFLHGPVCPVYGFGALAVIFALYGKTENILILFFASVFLTTTLEYLTSLLLEKLFHARWWDYSHRRFNIRGRISLAAAVVFGVMSVLMLKYVQPFLSLLTDMLSSSILAGLCALVFAAFIVDLVFTVRHILVLNGRLSEIQAAINGFLEQATQRAEEFKNTLLEKFEESDFYSDRIKNLCCQDKGRNERIVRAFPKLRSLKYNEALCKLKEELARMREKG